MKATALRSIPLGLLCALACGCLSKSESQPRRFFLPTAVEIPFDGQPTGQILNLSMSPSQPALEKRSMTWRLSDVEYFFDDTHHWTATPAAFVSTALDQALLSGAYQKSTGRSDLNLVVRVLRFEGVLQEPAHASVAIQALCYRGGAGTPIQREFEARAVLSGRKPEELARATGKALAQLGADVRSWLMELTTGTTSTPD